MQEESELRKYKELVEIKDKNAEFPIFCEPDLNDKLKGDAAIDISGYGPFRRLALISF